MMNYLGMAVGIIFILTNLFVLFYVLKITYFPSEKDIEDEKKLSYKGEV